MLQPVLIDSILNKVNILNQEKLKMHDTLVKAPLLHKHENGEIRLEDWDYRSIIGKLSYLCQNTRPDIEFAVHQCARFQANPMQTHKLAIKQICWYLLKTKHEGISMQPNTDFMKLECYADADFAGEYTPELSNNP